MMGAEGLINSRPLIYQLANPADDVPLTHNHFIHGQVGGQFAPTSCDEADFNPRKRLRFWTRWMREWLPGQGSTHDKKGSRRNVTSRLVTSC